LNYLLDFLGKALNAREWYVGAHFFSFLITSYFFDSWINLAIPIAAVVTTATEVILPKVLWNALNLFGLAAIILPEIGVMMSSTNDITPAMACGDFICG
jgi:hypothetical protein